MPPAIGDKLWLLQFWSFLECRNPKKSQLIFFCNMMKSMKRRQVYLIHFHVQFNTHWHFPYTWNICYAINGFGIKIFHILVPFTGFTTALSIIGKNNSYQNNYKAFGSDSSSFPWRQRCWCLNIKLLYIHNITTS